MTSPTSRRSRLARVLAWAVAAVSSTISLAAEAKDSNCPAGLATPYREAAGWPALPSGRSWGSVSAVTVDSRGFIWVADRCGANSCDGSNLAPIFKFDRTGRLLANFGAGLFVQPHGITVDGSGNVWVADAQSAPGKGQQVLKLSPDGKVLMRLGVAGVTGTGTTTFDQPTSVAIGPKGEIVVAEGHLPSNGNSRIVVFSKDGRFLRTWGVKGPGPAEFLGPHALVFDSRGRLFVADHGNNRVSVFDPQGKPVAQWMQFGTPSGLFIDSRDRLYVADSGSTEEANPGCVRGIRIGSARDGAVSAFIPGPPAAGGTSGAEGVAVDAAGVVYGAEVLGKTVTRYGPSP